MVKNKTNKKAKKNITKNSKKQYKKLTLKDFGAEDCTSRLKPIQCDCGCGGHGNIVLKTEQDKYDAIYGLLENEECDCAFIFIIGETDIVFGGTGFDGGVKCYTIVNDDSPNSFANKIYAVVSLVEDIEPHCVGILQCTGRGEDTYRIVTDVVYD